jgi:hypothetical protein
MTESFRLGQQIMTGKQNPGHTLFVLVIIARLEHSSDNQGESSAQSGSAPVTALGV